MRRLARLLLLVAVISASLLAQPQGASGVTAADWKPGRIIDDVIFTDKNSMSVADIQNFLNSKRTTCDRNGDISISYSWDNDNNPNTAAVYTTSSRAVYAQRLGKPLPPYTCLKDYYENPTTHENNLEGRSIPSGGVSSARIIWDAAQASSINPKALLVLIQKESSLVTDDWPWPTDYRGATGFGCPDTAPCDAQYYGLYNQVTKAASQYRRYMTFPNDYNHAQGRTSNVLYNPNLGCGSTQVYMETAATAALYNYTPYQPNTAALNNMYGTGDGCSAYGNRNFWRLYSDWFGSTLAPTYSWETQNISVNADLANMLPNQKATVTYTVKNTGSYIWERDGTNPVRLGTSNPQDRNSSFCDATWLGCTRPAVMAEASVPSGGTATFSFIIKAPSHTGEYREYFKPVVEGLTWLPNSNNNVYIKVIPPVYTYSVKGQGAYTDSAKSTPLDTSQLSPGQTGWYTLKITNTGNMPWSNTGANPMDLGTDGARDRSSRFATASWLGPNRPARLIENTVLPGQDGTFEWPFVTPVANGISREYYTPVIEGVTWLNATGLNYYAVLSAGYSWSVAGQYAYSNSSMLTSVDLTNLSPGQRVYIGVHAKNTGTATWFPGGVYPVHLGSSHPMDRSSAFCDAAWLGCNRPATMKNAANPSKTSVAPGETADFAFWYSAPTKTGIYYEYFNPVVENITWLNDPGVNFYTAVK